MKTAGFLLTIGLLISGLLSAQTNFNSQAPSFGLKKDTLNFGQFRDQQRQYRFPEQSQLLTVPKNKLFTENPSLAWNRPSEPRVFHDPIFRMPVVKPNFQSNMPVMKPDTSVHYHLLIKKIGKP